jgi:hypothetical protein
LRQLDAEHIAQSILRDVPAAIFRSCANGSYADFGFDQLFMVHTPKKEKQLRLFVKPCARLPPYRGNQSLALRVRIVYCLHVNPPSIFQFLSDYHFE